MYVFRDASRITFTTPQETCVVTEVERKVVREYHSVDGWFDLLGKVCRRPRECSSSRPVSDADFEKRTFLAQANPTSLMNEIVSLIPHYATFDSLRKVFFI
jgi:hypothetical protein